MTEEYSRTQSLITSLRERAKELSCLYRVDEILLSSEGIEKKLQLAAEAIPTGWYSPELCQARIRYMSVNYLSKGFVEGGPVLHEDLVVQGNVVGALTVSYPGGAPAMENGPFLPEERKLARTLSQRLSHTILHANLAQVFEDESQAAKTWRAGTESWRSILEMLFITDRKLYKTLCRRLLNHLNFIGVPQAQDLLNRWVGQAAADGSEPDHEGINQPIPKHMIDINPKIVEEILAITSSVLTDDQLMKLLQRWVGENRIEHFINVLDDHASAISEIIQAMDSHRTIVTEELALSPPVLNAVKVSLIRRFISRRLDYISTLKDYVTLNDFYELSRHLIFPPRSHGQLGGKGAGIFLARQILKHVTQDDPLLSSIKTPNTWYISSDGILDFVHYNRLEELLEYRYRYIEEIRMEYPNLIQLFKNCAFSPEMMQGLSMALDEIGEKPLIVRSSSLLEDSSEAAFSGKYKSLFLANQGTKRERLEALTDAISEVYASMFGPDPIEYRGERQLLDFQEEMGILIQEVVGTRFGDYFAPAFGGVAFSRNEFRWSARIKTNDGLVRIVPGLGTRAVDRLGDDYPVLMAPGQPGLRVNTSIDETIRYAPKYMDVINLKKRRIETVRIEDVIRESGPSYPQLDRVFSVYRDGIFRQVNMLTDYGNEFVLPTFEGLMGTGDFVPMMRRLLVLLEQRCGFPVDIEFAADGENVYLLQCRAQSSWQKEENIQLPDRPAPENLLFTAEKFVSDGLVPAVTHVVYVVPEAYDSLKDMNSLVNVGRTVGRLNGILPKGRFVLMGPGRWGSRGDVKLGVRVTYSDINNTAALIEMAFRKGNYVPDLSFGTHFFQDLVEASIRYLPLYPDDDGIVFNKPFFENSENILEKLLPETGELAEVIRVIDIPAATEGRFLRIAMSGDEGKAMAYLVNEETVSPGEGAKKIAGREPDKISQDEHWIWRQRMAEKLAQSIDPEQYGVKGAYLFGSTKNATAGPCSDIDLLLHVTGDEARKRLLMAYLNGWDLCLSEMNYIRTGIKTKGILDVHIVTDDDIEKKASYASKIGAVTDPARPLKLLKSRRTPAGG
jgi:predicted nucleotidyltransferase